MFKRIISTAVLIAVISSAMPPARAELDAAQITNRKEVIHTCLLNIYLAQKKRAQALSEYQILTGMKPNDSKLRYAYGVFILQGNTPADFNAAIVQIKKAEQLDPGNPDIHGALGGLYTKLKNPEEALKSYTKAIQYGGGAKYEKAYKDLQLFIQQKKQYELQKKKLLEQKKLIEEQKKKMQNADGTKKDPDDDDDW